MSSSQILEILICSPWIGLEEEQKLSLLNLKRRDTKIYLVTRPLTSGHPSVAYTDKFFRDNNFDFRYYKGKLHTKLFIIKRRDFARSMVIFGSENLRKLISKEITSGNPVLTAALTKLGGALLSEGRDCITATNIQNWLRGENLNKNTRDWFGRKLKDDTDFINAAQTILRILLRKYTKEGKIKAVYWLIDDCHFLSELQPSKFRSIQKGFLDVYNMSPKGFTLILAFAGETEHAVDLTADLLSRRDRKIDVHIMTPSQALSYIRELHSDKTYAKESHSDKFYPLTEKSAEKLVELFNTNKVPLRPRDINRYLDRIVGDAENEDRVVGEEYLIKKFKQYHKELGIIEEKNDEHV